MFKKIDVYYNGKYLYSTNSSKTCKEAKAKMLKLYPKMNEARLKVYFA